MHIEARRLPSGWLTPRSVWLRTHKQKIDILDLRDGHKDANTPDYFWTFANKVCSPSVLVPKIVGIL